MSLINGKRRFEKHPDTSVLEGMLRQTTKGETLTQEKMSAAIGRNVVPGDPHLESARRAVMREDRLVFAADGHHNLVCLTDEQVVELQDSNRKRIRNVNRRSHKQLSTVIVEELDNKARSDFFKWLSFIGAMAHVTSSKQVERLASKMTEPEQLPVAKTLDFLKDK